MAVKWCKLTQLNTSSQLQCKNKQLKKSHLMIEPSGNAALIVFRFSYLLTHKERKQAAQTLRYSIQLRNPRFTAPAYVETAVQLL
jgi:hypothetical protein